MSRFERNVNRVYTLGGLVLLITVVMAMSSCATQLTQREIEINYELDKLWIEYKYESDSLINELYKK